MSYNKSNIPLHLQFDLRKAIQKNPSYESFAPHRSHNVEYKYQGQDRPNTHMMSIIRRNPDGTLDYEWAKNMVIDAVHNAAHEAGNRPIHMALLTIIFPEKYRKMEPMQADLMTQFGPSEKSKVRQLVEAQLKEEENYNAGRGGGSVEGRSKTTDGVP